jgi:hypothetical protein
MVVIAVVASCAMDRWYVMLGIGALMLQKPCPWPFWSKALEWC